jgi:hypothetical protein
MVLVTAAAAAPLCGRRLVSGTPTRDERLANAAWPGRCMREGLWVGPESSCVAGPDMLAAHDNIATSSFMARALRQIQC